VEAETTGTYYYIIAIPNFIDGGFGRIYFDCSFTGEFMTIITSITSYYIISLAFKIEWQ
jgi:hypothetical protein